MPVLFVGEPIVLGFAPIRGKPVAQLMGADLPSRITRITGRGALRLHGQWTPGVTMVSGMIPENTERIRVLTITITAPQQVHRIGARSLNHAIA